MIGYLFGNTTVLEIGGGVAMCFGVKRLFTVHGLGRFLRRTRVGLSVRRSWARMLRRPVRHIR